MLSMLCWRGDDKSHPCSLLQGEGFVGSCVYLFCVNWVILLTVRDIFLDWFASFVDKKCRKAWPIAFLYLFWTIWKEINMIVFYNEDLLIQRMKNSFICNIWSWTKSCLDVGHFFLINFVDWLSSCWGLVSVCIYCSCLLVTHVYSLYASGYLLSSLYLIYFLWVYLPKKKKKYSLFNHLLKWWWKNIKTLIRWMCYFLL